MNKVFIGYDEGEKIAYYVLAESIRKYASKPVSIIPIALSGLKNTLFKRKKQKNQSTEFAFSRFLVPHLNDYKGWSLFMDCDMMVRSDINEVFKLAEEKYAVMCCQHNYEPKTSIKFRGAVNQTFEKKNWSSFMLINNKQCRTLTPEYVNTKSGLELHQFKWLNNDKDIGKIPKTWNWLVGEYDYNPEAKNVHFTLGGPYFKDYKDCDYSDEWFNIYEDLTKIDL